MLALMLGLLFGSALTSFRAAEQRRYEREFLGLAIRGAFGLYPYRGGRLERGSHAAYRHPAHAFQLRERRIKKLRVEKQAFADELAKYSITIPIAPPDAAPSGLPVWNAREMVEVRR